METKGQKLQTVLIRLYNDINTLEDLGVFHLVPHLESICSDIEAEIQIEINKGPKVTFK